MIEGASIENLLFHNIFWLSFNSATLFCIAMMANYDYLDDMADNTILLKDIKQLICAIAVVLAFGVASAVLIFIQVWRPYYGENYKNNETKSLQNVQNESEPMLAT